MLINDDYDGLPPPGYEPPGPPDWAVESMLANFERIARGVDVAHSLSCAICSLQNPRKWKDSQFTMGERNRLLAAFGWARRNIIDLFPHETAWANACCDAVAVLICLMGESPAERAARASSLRLDAHARARQIRNACHNLCLGYEIEERRSERMREVVADLLRRAVA